MHNKKAALKSAAFAICSLKLIKLTIYISDGMIFVCLKVCF